MPNWGSEGIDIRVHLIKRAHPLGVKVTALEVDEKERGSARRKSSLDVTAECEAAYVCVLCVDAGASPPPRVSAGEM